MAEYQTGVIEAYFDQLADGEWERLVKTPTAEIRLEVHSHYLRSFILFGGGHLLRKDKAVDPARQELARILREARSLLALPDNNFDWSSWTDAEAALAEMDRLIAVLDAGRLPYRLSLSVLFAPTGPIQEVSLSSGWGNEFLALADRFDAAVEAAYNAS